MDIFGLFSKRRRREMGRKDTLRSTHHEPGSALIADDTKVHVIRENINPFVV